MENEIIVLPEEVKNLAVQISSDKQNEVHTILTQIFTGTADWEKQIDAIEVKGIDDVMGIQLADVARKNVKSARLHAEKLFDSKREEVQSRMQNDRLEDALWLKSKQIMILKFKAIEDKATFKAEFVKRYEAEQKELRTQKRLVEIQKFKPEINRIEIENLSDDMFLVFLHGLEKEFNDRIDAERKAEEARIAKEKADADERARIKADNERLKKEAEERERSIAIERKKQADLLAKQKEESDKLKKEQELKLKKEREERERLEAELKAKKEFEQKKIKEQEAKAKAEKEALKKAERAPDKDKLLLYAKQLEQLEVPLVKSDEAKKITADIKTMLVKLRNYINENANKL